MKLNQVLEINKNIKNKRLDEILKFPENRNANKGMIGQLFETQIFNKELDNKKEADLDIVVNEYIPELSEYLNQTIKMELKIAGAKLKKNGEYSSKERLVLTTINYMEDYKYSFKDSSVYTKCKLMIIIYYIYNDKIDLTDFKILTTIIYNMDQNDLSILEKDYNIIMDKIKNGEAHLISGADTFYLEALTKGSSSKTVRKQPFSQEKAKQRAYALKNAYMTSIIQNHLNKENETEKLNLGTKKDELEYIDDKLKPFINKNIDEIMKTLGIEKLPAKHKNAQLIRKILGVKSNSLSNIEFFQKANVEFKTVRIKELKSGKYSAKESLYYTNNINLDEICKENWEDSKLYENVQKKYFYCFFLAKEDEVIFKGYRFRGFTEEEVSEWEKLWLKVKDIALYSENIEKDFPTQTSGFIGHTRTKGETREKSLVKLKNGQIVANRVFGLNNKVINEILLNELNK